MEGGCSAGAFSFLWCVLLCIRIRGISYSPATHTHTEVCERLWIRLVIGALVTDAEDQRSKPGALLQKG